jgi:nicotinamide riboside kinase
MNTVIVNLFGGPGSGKSTLAAEVFAEFKKQGRSVELVREYVKDWAYRKEPITKYDKPYLVAKQLRAESCLYGKVEFVITDCPLFICSVYEEFYDPDSALVYDFVEQLLSAQRKDGIRHVNLLVKRPAAAYDQVGRNETEAQAKEVDRLCVLMSFENGRELVPVRTVEDVRHAIGFDRVNQWADELKATK